VPSAPRARPGGVYERRAQLSGKPKVGDPQVEPPRRPRRHRLRNRLRLDHIVSRPCQETGQLGADDLLVLDHQDAAHARAPPRASATLVPGATGSSAPGSSTSTVVPAPGLVSTRSEPPCSRTIAAASGSPRPVPCPAGSVV